MIKPGAKWIMKKLTDVWSHQPNGTLHSYDYFENENGQWIYNIDFHYDGCFAPTSKENIHNKSRPKSEKDF